MELAVFAKAIYFVAFLALPIPAAVALFAQEPGAGAAPTVAGGAAVVACFLAACTALFGWLTARDKLRFDADVVQMKADLKYLREEVTECHNERTEQYRRLDEYHNEVTTLRAQLGINPGSALHTPLGGERRRPNAPPFFGNERRKPPHPSEPTGQSE